MKVCSRVNDEFVFEPEQVDENALAEAVKSHENRQWWLKHLWVSKVAVGLLGILIVITLAKLAKLSPKTCDFILRIGFLALR